MGNLSKKRKRTTSSEGRYFDERSNNILVVQIDWVPIWYEGEEIGVS